MKENKEEERLSSNDLMIYKDAIHKSMQAATSAEKAIAISKAAQAETKYVVLSIYLRNNLKPGRDDINENGVIVRGSDEEKTKEDKNE